MRENDDRQDDVFIVELEKGDDGIGLGLIDGLVGFKYSVLIYLLMFLCFWLTYLFVQITSNCVFFYIIL